VAQRQEGQGVVEGGGGGVRATRKGKEQKEGRGDLLEGIFAYYTINDIENMVRLNNKYEIYDKKNQLIRERIGDKVYLKLKRSME